MFTKLICTALIVVPLGAVTVDKALDANDEISTGMMAQDARTVGKAIYQQAVLDDFEFVENCTVSGNRIEELPSVRLGTHRTVDCEITQTDRGDDRIIVTVSNPIELPGTKAVFDSHGDTQTEVIRAGGAA